MMRKFNVAHAGAVLASLTILVSAPAGRAQQQQQQQKPGYTMAEYQDYKKCADMQDAQQKAACFEDFIVKHPKVDEQLMVPAVQQLYAAYNAVKNYPKTIQYADKILAYGDKVTPGGCFEAAYVRTQAFFNVFNEKDPNAKDPATKERDAAGQGLKCLAQVPKPDTVSPADFDKAKQQPTTLFNYAIGLTSAYLKDYKTAVDAFKASLAVSPNDGFTYYRLGLVYLQMDPPQSLDGFWALARAVALKVQGEAQIRDYLKKQVIRYQQVVSCDNLTDAEVNEMIQLAANSPERPATYTLPSADDLKAATAPGTNFIENLQAGGDKAKVTWLAVCGLEFPEVGGKVLEVTGDSSPITLKVCYASTPEAIEACTTPNMEAKIEGQPEVKRLQAGDPARFSGTLVSYDASPFMLHWEKCKVNPEDIPEEKAQPGKRPPKKPPKKPGR